MSFGCKVNQAETDRFINSLSDYDAVFCPKAEEADIVVVNTCAVTQKAQADGEKYLKTLKSRHSHIRIAATGCLAELAGENLKELGVEIVTPNSGKDSIIARLNLTKKTAPSFRPPHRTRAFLKVQDGCDRFCTYCIIPSLRGRPVSKPLHDAVEEAAAFVEKGHKEIVVTGIHIGLYGADTGSSLTELLGALVPIPGHFRIRLSSLDVHEIDENLLSLMRGAGAKICPHFHISLQSGSDKVLRLMGRKHTAEDFQSAVTLIRCRIPNACIGIDLIAGFPGETDALFEETATLVKNAGIDYMHVFPYSKRPLTPAAALPAQNAGSVKSARAKALRLLGEELRQKSMEKMIGKTAAVLSEKGGKGHTENFYPVKLPEGAKPNCFYTIEITGVAGGVLTGKFFHQ